MYTPSFLLKFIHISKKDQLLYLCEDLGLISKDGIGNNEWQFFLNWSNSYGNLGLVYSTIDEEKNGSVVRDQLLYAL